MDGLGAYCVNKSLIASLNTSRKYDVMGLLVKARIAKMVIVVKL